MELGAPGLRSLALLRIGCGLHALTWGVLALEFLLGLLLLWPRTRALEKVVVWERL